MRALLATLLIIGLTGQSAFAALGKFVDPETRFTLKYEVEVPQNVLKLVAKHLSDANPIFNRSKIYRTYNVGENALLVRIPTGELLVQTDIGRVDRIHSDFLRVWGDAIVVADRHEIKTLDRKTLTPIQTIKLPVRHGEGETKWGVMEAGNSLVLMMSWSPSAAAIALHFGCEALMLIPSSQNKLTSEFSSLFSIGLDGSMTNSSAFDAFRNFLGI